jgi:hypothetical protein
MDRAFFDSSDMGKQFILYLAPTRLHGFFLTFQNQPFSRQRVNGILVN